MANPNHTIFARPSGDVYPTWFNDTLVNVGTIPPKGYIDVVISVVFSNATAVRIHFDAYGSKELATPGVKYQLTVRRA